MRAPPQGRTVQCTPTRARSGAGRALARAGRARASAALCWLQQARLHGWPLSRLNVKAIRCAPSRGRAHTKVTAARGRAASRSLRPRPRHCRRAGVPQHCAALYNSGWLASCVGSASSHVTCLERAERQTERSACVCMRDRTRAHESFTNMAQTVSRVSQNAQTPAAATRRSPRPRGQEKQR